LVDHRLPQKRPFQIRNRNCFGKRVTGTPRGPSAPAKSRRESNYMRQCPILGYS